MVSFSVISYFYGFLLWFFLKHFSNSTAYVAQFSVLDIVFQVELKKCKGITDIFLGLVLAYLEAEMELLLVTV